MGRKMPTVVRPYTDKEVLALTYQGGKDAAYRDIRMAEINGHVLHTSASPWKLGTKFDAAWGRGYMNALYEKELLS